MAVDCFPLPRGSYWQSAPFGQQRATGVHRGIDYAANSGTPLHAPVAGRITVPAYEANGAGNNIWITDTRSRVWKMFHLQRIDVRTGQYVEAGQQVGTVGSTGRSSGPHLHLELHLGGPSNHVDPTSELAHPLRWPGDTTTLRPAPAPNAPTPPPAPAPKDDWMSRTLTIRGESGQYRLVDDGFGQLRKQGIPDMPRRNVLARAELVTGDLVELTDPAEIASLRAIPDVNPQTADVGVLVLAANIMAEVRSATERVLAANTGTPGVAPGTVDTGALVAAVMDELHHRLAE